MQLNCLCNSLLRLTTNKALKLCITGLVMGIHWLLVNTLTKASHSENVYMPCVIHYYIMMLLEFVDLSQSDRSKESPDESEKDAFLLKRRTQISEKGWEAPFRPHQSTFGLRPSGASCAWIGRPGQRYPGAGVPTTAAPGYRWPCHGAEGEWPQDHWWPSRSRSTHPLKKINDP